MNENPNENPLPTGNPAPAEFPSTNTQEAPVNPAPVEPQPVTNPAPAEPQPFIPQTPAEPQSFGTAPTDSPISVAAPKKNNNKLILIIIAAVLLLAGIGIALYFILKPKDNPNPSKQSKSDYSLFQNLATSLNDTLSIDVDDSGSTSLKFVSGPSAITGVKLSATYDAMSISLESVLADDGYLYLKPSGLSTFSALIPGLSEIDGSWIVLSPTELQTISESIASSFSVKAVDDCGENIPLSDTFLMFSELAKAAEDNFPLSLSSATSSELTGTVYRVNISSEKLIDLLVAIANSKTVQKITEETSNCLEPVATVDCDSEDCYEENSEYTILPSPSSKLDIASLADLTDEERAEYVEALDEVLSKLPPILISVDNNFRLTGILISGETVDEYETAQSYSIKLNLSYGSASAPTSSAITMSELFLMFSE